jgi:predicted GNAT family N-acyltransferase
MTINLLKIPNENTKEIKEIRKVVFTDELNISESYLLDKYDETCDQFLIKNGEITIGALRLRKENNAVKLERMAILSEFRKMSFGIKAINEVKKYCITKSESKIFLDSIYDIRDFYKKCGFTEIGSVFERVGLPHIRMEMSI